MEEEKKDVIAEESSPTEEIPETPETSEVVNTEQETTPAPETPEQPKEEVETSTPEVKEEVRDDRPLENVAWENKRKMDEIYPIIKGLPQMLQSQQEKAAPAKPTKEQLIYWKSLTTNPQELAQIEIELEKTRTDEMTKLVMESQKQTREQTLGETKKRQAYKWVEDNLPECLLRDGMGQVQGFDESKPLTRRIGMYMSDPDIARRPDGIMAAAKMAAFDMGISLKLTNKVNKTVGQLRKEQKKQLASAGGTRSAESAESVSKTKMLKLRQRYAETGDKDVFAEIVKLKRLNPFI